MISRFVTAMRRRIRRFLHGDLPRKPAVVPVAAAEASPSKEVVALSERDSWALSMKLFREAYGYYKERDRGSALAKVSEAVEVYPKNFRAVALKAEILAERGDVGKAAKLCNQVLKQDALNLSALNTLSSIGKPRDFTEAAYGREMRQVVVRILATVKYLTLHSKFLETISFSEVGMQLARLLDDRALDDTFQRLALEKVYALEIMGRVDEAIEFLDEIQDEVTAERVSAVRARCEMERGNFSEAARLFCLDDPEKCTHVITGAIPVFYGLNRIGEAHGRYRLRGSSKALREVVGNKSICDITLQDAVGRSLFLFAEGGPGDEIRFSTMYADLVRLFDKVSISCDPRLQSILERSYPSIHFVPVARFRRELRRDAPRDRDEINDAALRLFINHDSLEQSKEADLVGTTLEALADMRQSRSDFVTPSLLKADPDLIASLAVRMTSKRFRVGVAWRSMLRSTARNRHYFSPDDLRPFASLEDVEFWVLQPSADPEEIESLRQILPNVRVADGVDLIDDFESQAALYSNMDVVVAPFTSTAELAGALGVPTILLSNSHQTTWRRNADGTDVWYPSGIIVGANSVGNRAVTIEEAASILTSLREKGGGRSERTSATDVD